MPRGSAPGEHRGGRHAGTPNKRTFDVVAILESLDYEPIKEMVDAARDPESELPLRVQIASDIANYIYPKRKAIELKDERSSASDFLQLRALLEHYRNWRRAQGLPEIGALPDKCPTTPYTSSGAWDEAPAELAPAPAGRAAQTNGTARPALGNGKRET